MILSRDIINYSEILGQLVHKGKSEINADILAFCFNLFDSETFIKAISLLETNNVFIYIYTPNDSVAREDITNYFYEEQRIVLQRIIVKEESEEDKIIYVDLNNWFCSCDEFNCEFQNNIQNLSSLIEKKLSDETLSSNTHHTQIDKFAKIKDSENFNSTCKVMCSHLLAASILLQSSPSVFDHFTKTIQTCYIIKVTSIDEWLRLQCNIVVC